MGRARDSRRAQKNLRSANRNAKSRPEEDGSGVVDGSNGAARTRRNPDSASRDAERGYSNSNSEREDRTNCAPPTQPRSPGDPRSNLRDRQSLEGMEANGGMVGNYRDPTGVHDLNNHKGGTLGRPGTPGTPDSEVHGHNDPGYRVVDRSRSIKTRPSVGTLAESENAGHSQTSFDVAVTEYADQKHNPDNWGRSIAEGEIATRNQNPSGGRNAFDHKAGDGMGEGNQIARDTSINASIQHHNTQGRFDCNSGSYNNYGDKDSKFVNEGTFVNNGSMNFKRADGEGLENSGELTIIPHSTPTYLPQSPLTPENV